MHIVSRTDPKIIGAVHLSHADSVHALCYLIRYGRSLYGWNAEFANIYEASPNRKWWLDLFDYLPCFECWSKQGTHRGFLVLHSNVTPPFYLYLRLLNRSGQLKKFQSSFS